MKKHRLMGLVLSAALFSIFLPMALMLLWSVAGRWPGRDFCRKPTRSAP